MIAAAGPEAGAAVGSDDAALKGAANVPRLNDGGRLRGGREGMRRQEAPAGRLWVA